MRPDQSRPALLALGTAVPAHRIDQAQLCRWMIASLREQPALGRWLQWLYDHSGIETRYFCLADAQQPPEQSRFTPHQPHACAPTTAERMAIYQVEAIALGTAAARRALEDDALSDGGNVAQVAGSITHLLVVSCTGFFAPGLDQALARMLALDPKVERTVIGFMGCAAAFNALRLADTIVRSDPAARVLVVCVELCSLHIQPGTERANLITASLFGDGAAACVVGMPRPGDQDHFEIAAFHTSLHPDSADAMVWQIGDHGFTMQLSPQVPSRLGLLVPPVLDVLISNPAALRFWAIHPGGRAILDRLAGIFDLATTQIAPSRAVLRDYGNMSSPTILFVLHEVRQRFRRRRATEILDGVAMAFGPGLVIEMAHLRYIPGTTWNAVAQREGATVESLA